MENKNTGGIFSWLKNIASNANNTLNGEKAKKLKKKLIVWGGILTGVGILLILAGFISFISASMMTTRMPDAGLMIFGFISFVLGGFVLMFGSVMLNYGINIVIAGVGTKILDTEKEKKCPNCGDPINDDEMFCNKCGYNLRSNKVCSNCGFQNDYDDVYCKKCGKKL